MTAGLLHDTGVTDQARVGPRGAQLNLAHTPLPPRMRPAATLTVCDVTEFYGHTSGGVRTYLDRKAAYVARHPWLRQVIMVPGAADAIDEAEGTRWYALHGPQVPMQPPYRFMLALRQPRRIIEHERPHVVEIGSPGLVPWVVRHATRNATTPLVHFWHSHYPRQFGGRIGDRAWAQLTWRYAREIDRLFARTLVASAYAGRELASAGIDRVTHVPLGVDLERFHPARRVRSSMIRASFGLPANEPLAVYVGRMAREKQIDVVLRAWPQVRHRTGARLVLVGDGPDRARLTPLAEASHAIWLPFVKDRSRVADIMAAADILVAPSPIETFGLAALEAMACGTPVLAAHEGGAGELVLRSGGGATFAPGDAQSLRDAAVALFDHDVHGLYALGQAARRFAEREHDWDHVFDRLFTVYADILRDGGTPA